MAQGQRLRCWAIGLARIGIGLIFLYAGVIKTINPSGFLLDIQSFQLLPYSWAAAGAIYLPWLEVLAGGFLLIGRWGSRGALGVLTVLMAAFLVALLAAWARGLDITCGCFGHNVNHTGYGRLLTRDLVILAGIGLIWRFGRCPHPSVPGNGTAAWRSGGNKMQQRPGQNSSLVL